MVSVCLFVCMFQFGGCFSIRITCVSFSMFVSQMNENCVYHIQKHFQFVFGTLFFIPLSLLLADIQSYFIGYTLSIKSLRTFHFSF